MSRVKLTVKQRQELLKLHKQEFYRRYADRVKTILHLDSGWNLKKIGNALFLDKQTVRSYKKTFSKRGLNGLFENNYKGEIGKLTEKQEDELKQHISENNYTDSKKLREYISNNYGVEYSPTGIVDLLHRLGFTYKKPKIVPGKANAKNQQEYLDNKLKPALENASDKAPLYFVDGVHPTHNVQPQYGWTLKGTIKEIKTNSGRQRVNINGALCFHTLDVIYREDSTINRFSTLNLLEQIRSAHDPSVPITIVLDNAGYNKALEVKEYAALNKINLMFLPTYSPNLNLIERLWRFFKKKVCSEYYEKFKSFKNAVFGFFEDIGEYRKELSTLLTDKFHVIGN